MRAVSILTTSAVLLLTAGNVLATSPSFSLSPPSPTLGVVAATPADILTPAVPPVPGPLPPPIVSLPGAALGLVYQVGRQKGVARLSRARLERAAEVAGHLLPGA